MDNIVVQYNQLMQAGTDSNRKTKLNRKETAQYITDMVLEMRSLAKSVEMNSVQNLLELCFYEAFAAANKVAIPEGELERLIELSKASKVSSATA